MKNCLHILATSDEGFTLIELLVSVAIIGVLAAIAIPQMTEYRKRARDVERISDMRNIQGALEMYYVDNETYPGPTAGVSTKGEKIGDGAGALDAILLGLMGSVPRDPLHNSTYYYSYDPQHLTCDGDFGVALAFNKTERLKVIKQETLCGGDQGIDDADFNIMLFPEAT